MKGFNLQKEVYTALQHGPKEYTLLFAADTAWLLGKQGNWLREKKKANQNHLEHNNRRILVLVRRVLNNQKGFTAVHKEQ